MAEDPSQKRLIRLGVITGAHGVRGQVKIRSFTAIPEDIASYDSLQDKHGKLYRLTVTGGTADALIVTIEGIRDRNEAETLRNLELFVERGALAEPEEDEYYLEDLAGLDVFTEDGALYGKVISVNNFGAGDLVEIKLVSGKEEFQPFQKAIFPIIDIKHQKLVIIPPEYIE